VNLPNQITLARLGLAVVVFVLLETLCRHAVGGVWYGVFALFVLTVLSDGLDGYLARSRGEITAFGRIADPFADKIVICGTLVLLQDIPWTSPLVPSWIVLLVLAREFLISGLRGFLEGQGKVFGARWAGKVKLTVQAVYCGTVLFYPGNRWGWVETLAVLGLYATALITVYSAGIYVVRARELILREPDV